MKVYVEQRGSYSGGVFAGTPNLPVTPIETPVAEETFIARVTDPGGRSRGEIWHAHSKDGLWCYRRTEGDGSPWTVTFRPTGQQRDWYSTLKASRQATATTLLDDLRREAVLAAWPNAPKRATERCTDGQRMLAIHLRLAGATDIEAPCSCGGLLVVAMRNGSWGHVDACEACRGDMSDAWPSPCPAVAEHRFCGTPTPDLSPDALTSFDRRVLEFETQWWRRQGAKEHAIRQEFGGMSAQRYYRRLNQIIRTPGAVREFPVLVRRLQRIADRAVDAKNA